MLSKIITIVAILSSLVLVLILNFVSPASAGPAVVMLVFIAGYALVVSLTAYFIHFLSRLYSKLLWRKTAANNLQIQRGVSFRKAYYYASVLALAPLIILAMQSVGELGVYETLLILILVSLGCFYVSKRFK